MRFPLAFTKISPLNSVSVSSRVFRRPIRRGTMGSPQISPLNSLAFRSPKEHLPSQLPIFPFSSFSGEICISWAVTPTAMWAIITHDRHVVQLVSQSYSMGTTIQFRKGEESRAFHCAFEQWKKEVVLQGYLSSVKKEEVVFQGSCLQNGTLSASKSKFDEKIEPSSAKIYFHYYGQLQHQQNMLQHCVRASCISKL